MRKVCSTFRLVLNLGIFFVSLTAGGLFPSSASAEFYAGVMGGYVAPNDFSDVSGTGELTGWTFQDFSLDNTFMVGGKAGYYLSKWKWIGVETEAFYTQPDMAVFGHLRVITWANNLVVRYPGKRIQPYAGVGLGLFFAETGDLLGQSFSDNAVPGLNALAGIRAFVTDSVAVFGEYKYTRATFDLDTTVNGLTGGFDGDYSANMAVGGLSYHF